MKTVHGVVCASVVCVCVRDPSRLFNIALIAYL